MFEPHLQKIEVRYIIMDGARVKLIHPMIVKLSDSGHVGSEQTGWGWEPGIEAFAEWMGSRYKAVLECGHETKYTARMKGYIELHLEGLN